MASEEMVQVLRNHGVYAYGQESDIELIAEEWEDYDFSPDQADKWLEAGCFQAGDAYLMAFDGITPEQAAYRGEEMQYSIGYAVANNDMTIDEAKRIIEEVA